MWPVVSKFWSKEEISENLKYIEKERNNFKKKQNSTEETDF